MKTALSYLDSLKAQKNWASDYRTAKELEITHGAMSSYRAGRSIPDTDTCAKIAEGLGIDPLIVIAAAELERAARMSNEEAVGRWRVRWERAAAAAIALGIGISAALPSQPVYNMLNRRPKWAAFDTVRRLAQTFSVERRPAHFAASLRHATEARA